MNNTNKDVTSKKRMLFLLIFMFLMFLIIIIKLSFMQTHNLKASLGNLKKLSTKIVYGPSMPRGRILDRNYNVIVDNVGTNIISYKKEANVSVKDEIDYALSGKECLEKVKNAKYDLIFLDHMMPELDGVTTMKLLKESGYNIPPVVALTANSYTGLKGKYLEAGFSDYLSKPISFRELNKLINKFFSEK